MSVTPLQSGWSSIWGDPIAVFTLLLGVATFGLGIFTGLLWRATVKLAKDAKATADDQGARMERSLAEAAKASRAMERQNEIAERNADTSARHVQVAEQTSYSQLRPWIKLEVKGGFGRRISEAENLFSIQVTIINGGISPAMQSGVSVTSRLATDVNELGPINLPTNLGQFAPIFPGESMQHSCSYQPTIAECHELTQKATERGGMPMVVFDFKVSYRTAFSDQIHESAFRYLVFGQADDIEWLDRERPINSDITPRIEMRRQSDDLMT